MHAYALRHRQFFEHNRATHQLQCARLLDLGEQLIRRAAPQQTGQHDIRIKNKAHWKIFGLCFSATLCACGLYFGIDFIH